MERSSEPPSYLSAALTYAGSGSCESCHETEYGLWKDSHHDLAMQRATTETVLGDFEDSTFEHDGVTSTFSRRGDEFWVNTEGPDGELADYRVAYAFGVEPLQQYLLELPGGRLQALSIPWDTRPAAAGGQRWFHLYPDEHIPADDVLHWTGLNQNWNYMCAECHSTDLRKGYDSASDTYETTWAEIDVACEACHGPGSRHIAWAAEAADLVGAKLASARITNGLVVRLSDTDAPYWFFDEDAIARRRPRRSSDTQLETCGRCHSRRAVVRDPYIHGKPLLDSHRVSLLEPGLYHPDGQILEEVYVYGSFLQSRMHAEGVTCSDCHDPHSADLINEGNAVCARCHLPAKYDSRGHHRHAEGTPASQCVVCHMRSEIFMVVDPRRDHSFRVPRPDLSLELGTPNACTDCHRGTSPEWAADRFAEWWPERTLRPHFGEVLQSGRDGGPEAGAELARLVEDRQQPAIVRATALELLADYLDPVSLGSLERASRDADPLVRMAAAGALGGLDAETRLRLARPLLDDPVLGVRIEAALGVVELTGQQADPADLPKIASALEDLRQAQWVNADRPEAHVVLGALHAQAGEATEAMAEYEQALALDPASIAARVNLADLYRQTGDEASAERALREALKLEPENADIHHALGLSLVRQGRTADAVAALERAATLSPGNLRYGYVHAVAVHSTGRIPRAIRLLEAQHEQWPANTDVLVALATYFAQMGGFSEAESFAIKLVELAPGDPQAEALLLQIRSRSQ